MILRDLKTKGSLFKTLSSELRTIKVCSAGGTRDLNGLYPQIAGPIWPRRRSCVKMGKSCVVRVHGYDHRPDAQNFSRRWTVVRVSHDGIKYFNVPADDWIVARRRLQNTILATHDTGTSLWILPSCECRATQIIARGSLWISITDHRLVYLYEPLRNFGDG